MKILVVEDEMLVSMVVEDALCDAGHIVLTAESADKALEVLSENDDISILLTDVNMPGSMNGLELAARVRTERPEIKIIVASGRQHVESGRMPSDSLFLPKPYLPKDIIGAVQTMTS